MSTFAPLGVRSIFVYKPLPMGEDPGVVAPKELFLPGSTVSQGNHALTIRFSDDGRFSGQPG